MGIDSLENKTISFNKGFEDAKAGKRYNHQPGLNLPHYVKGHNSFARSKLS